MISPLVNVNIYKIFPNKDKPLLESSLQKKILKFCNANCILAVKVDSTSTRGWPDLTCLLPNGVVLFVEVKIPTGVVSALQKRMISKINSNKGTAHVVRSEKEFIDLIESKI